MAFTINKKALAALEAVKAPVVKVTKSLEAATKEEKNLITFLCKVKKAEMSTWMKDDGELAAVIDTTAVSLDGKVSKEITFHVLDSEVVAMLQTNKGYSVVEAAFGKSEANKHRLYAVRAEAYKAADDDDAE